MIRTYNSMFSTFPFDLNEDQHQQLFTAKPADAASSSSSFSYNYPPIEGEGYYHGRLQPFRLQEGANRHISHIGSFDHQTLKNQSDNSFKLSVCKTEDRNENQTENGSVTWTSSKIRLMRRMNSDPLVADTPETSMQKFEDQKDPSSPLQPDNSNNSSSTNNSNNPVRVCADCNTTKTPLWRSGPRGPKSLCNACGIRQRKARRAMAAAAAAASAHGAIFTDESTTKKSKAQEKGKKAGSNTHLPFKKRCKFTGQARGRKKKLCFEDLTIILSKNSAFQRVFPQDEKDAAILLMALSYGGLVHG